MNDSMNIFRVLSKDDKELIHSAFISFLLSQYSVVRQEILGSEFGEINYPELEVAYSYKTEFKDGDEIKYKKKRIRFDIQIKSLDNSKLCVIENKFKCLPTKNQLDEYSGFISNHFDKIEVKKILISFSDCTKNILPEDWIQLTYSDIYRIINKIDDYGSLKNKIFIEEYLSFLSEYLKEYETYQNVKLRELFENPTNGENRFWLRLILSELLVKLHAYQDKFDFFYIDLGGSNVPLINLHSNFIWRKENHEFVIQFQGSDIKFYSHFWNGIDGKQLVVETIQSLKNNNLETKESGIFKRLNNKLEKSMFVYKEDILKEIPEKDFNLSTIEKYIIHFFERFERTTNR